jgi:hypothetical protein
MIGQRRLNERPEQNSNITRYFSHRVSLPKSSFPALDFGTVIIRKEMNLAEQWKYKTVSRALVSLHIKEFPSAHSTAGS